MLKTIILKGCPGSGKSFYCRELMKKEPGQWRRINNDALREAFDFGVWSQENEKSIRSARDFLLKEFLTKGFNVLVDNINASARSFDDVCKVVKGLNLDVQVIEKPFYIELSEAIERDSKREGNAKVGEAVVKKWHKELGGTQFKHYHAKVEMFSKRTTAADRFVEPIKQDESLPRAVVWDNDGTISLIHSGRSPYDASTSDQDIPQKHAIECMKLYHDAGYKILFVSGREEKDRAPTERFYQKHFPEVKYELYMRPTGSFEKDVIIKERIYNEHIKGKYFIAGWFDDRLQIVDWLFLNGFPVFRLGDPRASF